MEGTTSKLFSVFSPEGKAKIQLQIVLHDGNSTTFHFVNQGGRQLVIIELGSLSIKEVGGLYQGDRQLVNQGCRQLISRR